VLDDGAASALDRRCEAASELGRLDARSGCVVQAAANLGRSEALGGFGRVERPDDVVVEPQPSELADLVTLTFELRLGARQANDPTAGETAVDLLMVASPTSCPPASSPTHQPPLRPDAPTPIRSRSITRTRIVGSARSNAQAVHSPV